MGTNEPRGCPVAGCPHVRHICSSRSGVLVRAHSGNVMSGAVQNRAAHLHTACRPVGLCWGRPGEEALQIETLLPHTNSCKVPDKMYTFTHSTMREPSPLWVLEREPPATEVPAGAWGAGVFPPKTWGVRAGRGAVACSWAQVQPLRLGLSSLGTLLNPPSCDTASVTAESEKFPI